MQTTIYFRLGRCDPKDPVGMAEKHIEIIMDEDIVEMFDDFKMLDAKEKNIVKNFVHSLADAKKDA